MLQFQQQQSEIARYGVWNARHRSVLMITYTPTHRSWFRTFEIDIRRSSDQKFNIQHWTLQWFLYKFILFFHSLGLVFHHGQTDNSIDVFILIHTSKFMIWSVARPMAACHMLVHRYASQSTAFRKRRKFKCPLRVAMCCAAGENWLCTYQTLGE